MMPTLTRRLPRGGPQARPRSCCTVLVTLGFALSVGMPALAEEAARPDGASGAGPLAWVLLFLPALVIIFFLIPLIRRQKRYSTQANRSLEIS